MRLLHITHQYKPAVGGSEKYIADLSEELAARGHLVDVFTTRATDYHTWENHLPRRERIAGVEVHRFDSFQRTRRSWDMMNGAFRRYWQSPARRYEPLIFWGSGPVSPGLFRAIRSRAAAYDAVHINQLHYSHAYTAHVALKGLRKPVVLTPHLHAEQRETWDVGYLRTALRASHVVLAVSDAERDHLVRHRLCDTAVLGGNGLRMTDYPRLDPAAARARLGLGEGAFVVLFLGRKTDYKGLDVTLDAFQRLRAERPEAVFLAVGSETPFSEALWRRAGDVPGVIRRETVPDEEKQAALAACDVLCLPSTGEAFGIVYLEAWAHAKPVIGARIASVASIIADGETGLLVAPGDAGALAELLRRLSAGRGWARGMGERGHQTLLRRYTVERIADVVEGAYAIARRHAAAQSPTVS